MLLLGMLVTFVMMSMLRSITCGPIMVRKDPLEYFLAEELPPNTRIGNVPIDAFYNEKYNDTIRSQLRFSFVNEDPRKYLFAVDERSGTVRTTQKIDRDTICPKKAEECLVWLHVGVTPFEYSDTIRIRVEILDVNDHTPAFPKIVMPLQIMETTPVGTSWVLPPAVDEDSDKFAVTSYELHFDEQDTFELQVIGDLGSEELRLLLRRKLDREEAAFHQLGVVAVDGGSPALTGTLLVNVTVLDANDNDPTCSNATYEFFVMENKPGDTVIGQIRAEDRDLGANGEITYALSTDSERRYGGLFGIGNRTGMLYQRTTLDFEKGSTYLLEVTARDLGSDSRPGHCTIVVRVEDDNDNDPEIQLGTLPPDNTLRVAESARLGTVVAQITVSDQDGGDNGKVECSLTHSHFSLETVHGTQYKILTSAILDATRNRQYELTVVCRDLGSPSNVAMQNVIIQVVTDHDHRPVFTQSIYMALLRENNNVDELVIQVHANDPDSGSFGEVRYALYADAGDDFRIDSVTGQIVTNKVWDHEMETGRTFRVIAYDMGTPALSSTATIQLTIQDISDDELLFSLPTYEFGVYENMDVSSEVGQIFVQDEADIDLTGLFHFSFADSDSPDSLAFFIEPRSGKIRTRTILDREDQPVYYLSVVARNEGFPPMTGTVSVTIYVADKNDNDPVIAFPSELNNTVLLSRQTPVGFGVAQIRAHDNDVGINGRLTYSVIGGNVGDVFDVNPHSGEVTIVNPLQEAEHTQYGLLIQVEDHGLPERVTRKRLNIIINDTLEFVMSDPARAVVAQQHATIVVSVTAACLILVFLVLFSFMMYLVYKRYSPARRKNTTEKYAYSQPPLANITGSMVADQEINISTMLPETEENLQYMQPVTPINLRRPVSPPMCVVSPSQSLIAQQQQQQQHLQQQSHQPQQQQRRHHRAPSTSPPPPPPPSSSSSSHPSTSRVASTRPSTSSQRSPSSSPPPTTVAVVSYSSSPSQIDSHRAHSRDVPYSNDSDSDYIDNTNVNINNPRAEKTDRKKSIQLQGIGDVSSGEGSSSGRRSRPPPPPRVRSPQSPTTPPAVTGPPPRLTDSPPPAYDTCVPRSRTSAAAPPSPAYSNTSWTSSMAASDEALIHHMNSQMEASTA